MSHDSNALHQRMGLPSLAPPVRRVNGSVQFGVMTAPEARRILAAKSAADAAPALDDSQLQALMRAIRAMFLPELRALPPALAAELYRVLVTEAPAAPTVTEFASRSFVRLSR